MHSQTNEQALEAAIQETLSGTTIEMIKEQNPSVNISNPDSDSKKFTMYIPYWA